MYAIKVSAAIGRAMESPPEEHRSVVARRGVLNSFTLVALVLVALSILMPTTEGIGCYICSSKNGSDVNCEDPFHPGLSTYADTCQVAKKKHIGTFPGNFCVKIVGTSVKTAESLMIRICVLENMDSQCGLFKFQDEELTGCILTCTGDGCNGAEGPTYSVLLSVTSLLLTLLFTLT